MDDSLAERRETDAAAAEASWQIGTRFHSLFLERPATRPNYD